MKYRVWSDPNAAGTLRCFSKRLGPVRPYLADLRQEIERNREYRLIISVKHSPPGVWGLLLESGVPQAPRVTRPLGGNATFIEALQDIYAALLSEIDGDIFVELVLPFDQLACNVEIAGIIPTLPVPVPATPLCHRYPLVLRWRERILKPGAYQGERWHRAAKLVAERTAASNCIPTVGRLPAVQDPSFWATLEQPPHDLLDLGYQLARTTECDVLANALYNGTAYACWPRDPHSPALSARDYENDLSDLVATGSFNELPLRAVEMRKNSAPSQHVALLWDDPETNPVAFIRTFEEVK